MKIKLLLAAAFTSLLFASCSNEENQNGSNDNKFAPKSNFNSNPDSEFYAYRAEALASMKQTLFFSAQSEQVTLTSEKGVEIRIIPSQLKVNGKPVKGKVRVDFIELTSRGEMALTAMPTQTNSETGSNALFSGGEFFIEMTTESGEQVDEGSPYTLAVPTDLTQNEEGGEQIPESGTDGMTLWEGEEDENGNVNWVEETGEDGEVVEIPVVDGKYIVELLSFEWCNIDKLEKMEGKRTNVTVDVPDGFDFNNTRVYFIYTGSANLCIQLNYDPVSGDYFHNNLVVGMSGTIIMWTPGQSVVATMPLTVAGNDLVTITYGDLVTTTNAQLIAMLNSLP